MRCTFGAEYADQYRLSMASLSSVTPGIASGGHLALDQRQWYPLANQKSSAFCSMTIPRELRSLLSFNQSVCFRAKLVSCLISNHQPATEVVFQAQETKNLRSV